MKRKPSKTERLLALARDQETDVYDSAASYLVKQRFAKLVITDEGREHAQRVLRDRGQNEQEDKD